MLRPTRPHTGRAARMLHYALHLSVCLSDCHADCSSHLHYRASPPPCGRNVRRVGHSQYGLNSSCEDQAVVVTAYLVHCSPGTSCCKPVWPHCELTKLQASALVESTSRYLVILVNVRRIHPVLHISMNAVYESCSSRLMRPHVREVFRI